MNNTGNYMAGNTVGTLGRDFHVAHDVFSYAAPAAAQMCLDSLMRDVLVRIGTGMKDPQIVNAVLLQVMETGENDLLVFTTMDDEGHAVTWQIIEI
jgi:hypothetical protein